MLYTVEADQQGQMTDGGYSLGKGPSPSAVSPITAKKPRPSRIGDVTGATCGQHERRVRAQPAQPLLSAAKQPEALFRPLSIRLPRRYTKGGHKDSKAARGDACLLLACSPTKTPTRPRRCTSSPPVLSAPLKSTLSPPFRPIRWPARGDVLAWILSRKPSSISQRVRDVSWPLTTCVNQFLSTNQYLPASHPLFAPRDAASWNATNI